MKITKKTVVKALYLLAFMSLVSVVFMSGANLIFVDIPSAKFESFYNLLNWLTLAFSILCCSIIITNFFLKRKFDWVEVAILVLTIIFCIVMTVIGTDVLKDVSNSASIAIYTTYMAQFFADMATFVLLLVTKLISMFCFKNEVNDEEK